MCSGLCKLYDHIWHNVESSMKPRSTNMMMITKFPRTILALRLRWGFPRNTKKLHPALATFLIKCSSQKIMQEKHGIKCEQGHTCKQNINESNVYVSKRIGRDFETLKNIVFNRTLWEYRFTQYYDLCEILVEHAEPNLV